MNTRPSIRGWSPMNSTTTSSSIASATSRLRSPSSVVIATASELSSASRSVTKSNRSKIELSLCTSARFSFSISGAILVQPAHDPLGDAPVAATGAVDQLDARHLSHPGELTPRVCAMGAFHGLDVAGPELVEAQRRAGCPRGSRSGAGASLLGGARGDHLLDPRLDPARQLGAVDGQPDEQGGTTELRGPKLLAPQWRIHAGALELEHPGDPLAVPRMNRGRDVGVELTVDGLGAALGDLTLHL